MEFLHCNFCGFLPSNLDRRRFYLTSCGHVLCDVCLKNQGNSESCLLCKVQCRCLEICANSTPGIKSYFLDQAEVLESSLRNSIQITTFQRCQMKSYRYQVSKLMENKVELEMENKKLKEQISVLTKELQAEKKHYWESKHIPHPTRDERVQVDSTERTLSLVPKKPAQPVSSYSISKSSGSRLTNVGHGRLTLPYTPLRLDVHRKYSPAVTPHTVTPISTFTMYGTPSGVTPDIMTRLRQIQCYPKSGSSEFGRQRT